MNLNSRLIAYSLALLLVVAAAPGVNAAEKENSPLTDPAAANLKAPDQFQVKIVTSAGDFVIEVHRDWSPMGADRFFNLVKVGFYDGAAFYRVLREPKPFMAQVGFNGNPKIDAAWRKATIGDDPMVQSNRRGFVSFAKSNAPNSRTTQFFVNYADNSYLDGYGFSPFGKVVKGMEAVDALYSGYGEGAPQGKGPSQARIASEGNAYLEADFPKLDSIIVTDLIR
ncbi:MAG: peptidylprolyl isomerase [Thermoanaerobaculales bacterium]|nr:peptidylprolyl isomerase [Thermoanaerobaculales bacterium]